MGLFEEFVRIRTYARWIDTEKRRETWEETVDRYCDFIFNETLNCDRIPDKTKYKIKKYILNKEDMPSMRLLSSAGESCRRDNSAAYNCSAIAIHSLECFGEAMLLLLNGVGVGYSVESKYTSQLPEIHKQRNLPVLKFVVPDTKLGWKQAVDYGLKEWYNGRDVVFDLSQIRPAGTPLIISGGYASGREPLSRCLEFLRSVIIDAQGRQLRPIELSDMMCEIGASVVSGGVRRTAMICLCDVDDEELRLSKQGSFHPRRFMANISAVYHKKPNVLDFTQEFVDMAKSGSGERGIFNLYAARKRAPKRRDRKKLIITNPCFRGDMRLLTTEGYVAFEELAKREFVEIINKDGNVSIGHVWANPELKEIVEVRFENQYSIYCTGDHKFMLEDGSSCEAWHLKGKCVKEAYRSCDGHWFTNSSVFVTNVFGSHTNEIVYDFSEPITNWGVVEGKVVHNCAETILRDMGFCNLTEVVVRPHDDFDSIMDKIKTATWIGCIQSTLTYFPHLRPEWKKNAEEERLIGVSLTGMCDNIELFTPENMRHFKNKVIKTAKTASEILDINMPVATTLCKPSGCRTWDSLTTTNSGILTLEELLKDHPEGEEWHDVPKDSPKVVQDMGESRITKTYYNGPSEIIRINMNLGLHVKSTPNHQWFVKNRHLKNGRYEDVGLWKRADEIEPGDILDISIGVYNRTTHYKFHRFNPLSIKMRMDCDEITQPICMNEDIAWFLGYLWGDGAMSPGKYRVRFLDEHLMNLEKIQRVLHDNFSISCVIRPASQGRNASYIDVASKSFWHWLIRNDVWKYFADSINIIPLCVRGSAKCDILAFIAGLIDSDGCAKAYTNGVGSVTIATASKLFAEHLQSVAWAVGVTMGCSFNSRGNNLQQQKSMYLLGFNSYCNRDDMEVVIRNSNKMLLAREAAEFIRWRWESQGVHNHILGKVKNTESVGVEETYDIEVEGEHWYYNGSVKSHNTVSSLVNSASGIHSRWAPFYIRRVRISIHDALFKMMVAQGMPYENDAGNHDTAVFSFPVKSPDHAKCRDSDTAIGQLDWYRSIVENWTEQNASATIYVNDDEWLDVTSYVYKHFDSINGVTFFPYDNKKYAQAPFEEIDEFTYYKMSSEMPEIDFTQLHYFEERDTTTCAQTLACAGNSCELA